MVKMVHVIWFFIFFNVVAYSYPAFDEAMKVSGWRYDASVVNKDSNWVLTKALYKKNIGKCLEDDEVLIPKIIHHIWIGGRLPDKYHYFIKTWQKKHPDWKHIVWLEEDIEAFGLINHADYKQAKNKGEKSDIARYEILYRIGGLYVDTDFECLQSFDRLHSGCDFYAGLSHMTTRNGGIHYEVYNGLIGSRPGHPILKKVIEQLPKSRKKNTHILGKTGPWFFSECIKSCLTFLEDRTIIFPTTYFYPWPNFKRAENKRSQIERYFMPHSLAVHHWYVSWSK